VSAAGWRFIIFFIIFIIIIIIFFFRPAERLPPPGNNSAPVRLRVAAALGWSPRARRAAHGRYPPIRGDDPR
jgi:hypothetical protein